MLTMRGFVITLEVEAWRYNKLRLVKNRNSPTLKPHERGQGEGGGKGIENLAKGHGKDNVITGPNIKRTCLGSQEAKANGDLGKGTGSGRS